jgi:DNA modification methylase
MKPVELLERAIQNSSRRGEIVADFFGGSGSTLIACERMGRKCRMMELAPVYCDVILRRWAAHTRKQPVLAATGAIFSQVERERLTPIETASEIEEPAVSLAGSEVAITK